MSEDIGDFGFADNEDHGKGEGAFKSPEARGPSAAANSGINPKRKGSARNMGLYAKSPMQRQQEAVQDMEFQEMLHKDVEGDGGDAASPPPNQSQVGGHQLWGAAGKAGFAGGVVIPPFVPRDQRNKRSWDVGQMSKRVADKNLLAGANGDFLIREAPSKQSTLPQYKVCVHDGTKGVVVEQAVRQNKDRVFMFMAREFTDLGDIVKHLQRNPLYNSAGLPLYIDKPCKITE